VAVAQRLSRAANKSSLRLPPDTAADLGAYRQKGRERYSWVFHKDVFSLQNRRHHHCRRRLDHQQELARRVPVRKVDHRDLFADRVEERATQLAAVADVARVAGRAGVDHQDLGEAAHQLMVGVTV